MSLISKHMNIRNLGKAIVLAACTGAGATVLAAGDAGAGQIKAIPCLGCHGIEGYFTVYPTYHVPKVGGQHAAYVIAALKAYKSGERGHKTMQAQAATLSEQDMQDIAAFFESAGQQGD